MRAARLLAAAGEAAAASPLRALAVLLALHALVLTALPVTFHAGAPYDVLEAVNYGPHWQFGYWKHPPLPWWLVAALGLAFGDALWPIYLQSQAAILAGHLALWRLASAIVPACAALAAVAALDAVHYFTLQSPNFNHNVALYPMWTACGWLAWRALRFGRTRDWLALGAVAALGLWSKYAIGVLLAALAGYMLADARARRTLLRAGPWLALVAFAAVASPHLAWLVANDFMPLDHVQDRAPDAGGWGRRHWLAARFVAEQALYLLPAAGVLLLARWRGGAAAPGPEAFDRRFLGLLAFGPLGLLLALSLLSGGQIRESWGYHFVVFPVLWAVAALRAPGAAGLGLAAAGWAAMQAVWIAAFVANAVTGASSARGARTTDIPGRALAAAVSEAWRRETGTALAYVFQPRLMVEAMTASAAVSFHAPGRPPVVLDGPARIQPWIDFADVRRRGLAVVWLAQHGAGAPPLPPPPLGTPRAQPPIELAGPRGMRLTFGFAVVPPEGERQ